VISLQEKLPNCSIYTDLDITTQPVETEQAQ